MVILWCTVATCCISQQRTKAFHNWLTATRNSDAFPCHPFPFTCDPHAFSAKLGRELFRGMPQVHALAPGIQLYKAVRSKWKRANHTTRVWHKHSVCGHTAYILSIMLVGYHSNGPMQKSSNHLYKTTNLDLEPCSSRRKRMQKQS